MFFKALRKLFSWDFFPPAATLLCFATVLMILTDFGIGAILVAVGTIGLLATTYLTIMSD